MGRRNLSSWHPVCDQAIFNPIVRPFRTKESISQIKLKMLQSHWYAICFWAFSSKLKIPDQVYSFTSLLHILKIRSAEIQLLNFYFSLVKIASLNMFVQISFLTTPTSQFNPTNHPRWDKTRQDTFRVRVHQTQVYFASQTCWYLWIDSGRGINLVATFCQGRCFQWFVCCLWAKV